jgi:hypothetical protein
VIAEATGFSADEIEAFDPGRLAFWWGCVMAGRRLQKEWKG